MVVTIDVTQDDIDHGTAGNCWACPVARAVRRVLGLEDIGVGTTDMDLGQGTKVIVVPTPDVAADFMTAFDTGKKVAPFSFTLDVPDSLVPAGAAS
jgi:hypothetical protein